MMGTWLARFACVLIAAVGLAAAAPQASAAVCGTHAGMTKFLADRYEESTRGLGLVSDRGVVELFISQKGTWSILITGVEGRTCILAAGHTWKELEVALEGPAA